MMNSVTLSNDRYRPASVRPRSAIVAARRSHGSLDSRTASAVSKKVPGRLRPRRAEPARPPPLFICRRTVRETNPLLKV